MTGDTVSEKASGTLLVNVLLLGVSLCVTLMLGEVGARYVFKAWPFQSPAAELPYLTERDTNLRWRFSPDGGRSSLGLLGEEIQQKRDGVFRILFLGDSLVWSGRTTSGALYTEVLEDELGNAGSIGKPVEVINAGVPGYTTYQELEFLNVYGWDMQPDLVILSFVFNDVYYPYLHRPTKDALLGREPQLHLHHLDTSFFPTSLLSKSYLAHGSAYAIEMLLSKLLNRPDFSFERRGDFYLAWKSYGWTDTERLIRRMNQQTGERDIPVILVVFPVRDQLDDELLEIDREYVLYPQGRIGHICKEEGIPYLDLTDPLYTSGGATLFSDYLHLNEMGNDLVARELARFLVDNQPLWLEPGEPQ